MAKFSTGTSTFQPSAKALSRVNAPGRTRYYLDINREASSGAATAYRHLEITDKAAETLNHFRETVDPTVTEAMHKLRVEKANGEFLANFTKGQANALTALRASLAEAEYKLTAKVGVTPTGDAREIRDRLAAMPADVRLATMREAFATGDKAVMGAIVGFSKVMHGCDPAIVEPLFEKFKREVARSEYAVVDEHKKYLGYVEAAEPDVYRFSVEALKGCSGYVKAKEQYDAVSQSFEQSDPEPEAE